MPLESNNTSKTPQLCCRVYFIGHSTQDKEQTKSRDGMALRKGTIVEAAGVQRSGGAGEKEEVLGNTNGYLEIPLCNPYVAYHSA